MERKDKSPEELLDLFVGTYLPKDFKFREGQREVILDVVNYYIENPKGTYILEAPTGSGKSIIAMCVAGILNGMKKNGYILASDLMLQDQYRRDFENFKVNWGSVKGVNNYTCHVNGELFPDGDCKLKGLKTSSQAKTLECFGTCGYYSARELAINSDTTLLNYSYWLLQMNYVLPRLKDNAPFGTRDFTICDEAHKIPDIVQNHFSPCLPEKLIDKYQKIILLTKSVLGIELRNRVKKFQSLFNSLKRKTNQKEIFDVLKSMYSFLSNLEAEVNENELEEKINLLANDSPEKITTDHKQILKLCRTFEDMRRKLEDYIEIIENAGVDTLIKKVDTKKKEIVITCLENHFLVKRHFHEKANFKFLMSATIGKDLVFAKEIGCNSYRFKRMKSTFNFERSPIYYWKGYKMSKNKKESSMKWIVNTIEQIFEKHSTERGIIHSGSYSLGYSLYSQLSEKHKKRVLLYLDSKSKDAVLEEFKRMDNAVLIGPSILEGLDLKDDLSRFQIFAKVPYPYLGDSYVAAKMKKYPYWYSWKTIISILQGVGRSVRSSDDYAITYFLDGCFVDLLKRNKDSFPDEFMNRLQLMEC